jgi:alkylated DNA repair dioxygenase AlkB
MAEVNSELSLFGVSTHLPEGFVCREKFLSEPEERELIREIEELQFRPFQYYQFTGKRRMVSFGWQYEFGKKDIMPAPDIPEFLLPVRTRAETLFGIAPESLVHASVIEYSVGAPIGWHRDIPYFGEVIGVSLGAACRMRFRPYLRGRSKTKRNDALSIELQPRSVYLMSGASRATWQHSIPPVKGLRYAIMMRTLRA